MKRIDPLRRFAPAPQVIELNLMGHRLRLETDSKKILDHVSGLFSTYPDRPNRFPEFVWRIISQTDFQMGPPWPERSAFADHGLCCIAFGQRNFLAVDLDMQEGIGFVAEGLAEDALGLTSPFLDNLFCMTAASLGLTAISAACVGLGNAGLLVVGSPNSGKTTSCYIAARNGLEYHADRALFVEQKSGVIRAWGDFWPAAFRPDTLRFLPELAASAHLFRYSNFTFYYLDKRALQASPMHSIIPACCVFLERGRTTQPRLTEVPRAEFARRVTRLAAFQDDIRFDAQRASVFAALEALPAYDFAYREDPADAAGVFHELLHRHPAQENTGRLHRESSG